jgi:transcriptional regulator with XRE-family HTH domain
MPRPPRDPAALPSLFAERLNHLLATRRQPDGTPYTLQALSQATNGVIRPNYLSMMRRGQIALPGADKLEALARVFGVPVAYFTGADLPDTTALTADEELRSALMNPLVQEIVRRVKEFGPEEWRHMLAILDHQLALQRLIEQRVQDRLRHANPPPLPPTCPQP